ncbi:hypothetical protein H0H93_006566 [Arthromyces matolae]|nr:hypothetical protein H0H93_006566 [Arthromyces matolae]
MRSTGDKLTTRIPPYPHAPLCWSELFLDMRLYLTSTVYALVLAQFLVALAPASPIPLPELAPRESSNTDLDDNSSSVSPLVVRSGSNQGVVVQPPDLWSGKVYFPTTFWPRPSGKRLFLKIPNKKYPQGLNSIINIAGLMRTAVEANKLEGGTRSTSCTLARWIRKLEAAKVLGAMVLAEPLISPSIKTLEGVALMERKEMIRDAVMAHNNGEWYTPTSEIEDQIRHLHRNWKTVKIENQKIIKAASHNTAPTQQHQSIVLCSEFRSHGTWLINNDVTILYNTQRL